MRTAPCPRSTGGTLTNRISSVRNVITPMWSVIYSRPSARTAEIHSGCRRIQEANAGGRKAKGTHNLPDRAIPDLKGC